MANKKQKQAQKRQQAQHRQTHNASKSHQRDEHREHLPKTGTKADDQYLLRRSREDLVDFGLGERKSRTLLIVLGALVFVAIVGLIAVLTVFS